ncbi:hypothetical protein JYG30_05325 [Fibrella sp. USSR17]
MWQLSSRYSLRKPLTGLRRAVVVDWNLTVRKFLANVPARLRIAAVQKWAGRARRWGDIGARCFLAEIAPAVFP